MMPLTCAIRERIRGGYDDALYKSTFTLLTLLHESQPHPNGILISSKVFALSVAERCRHSTDTKLLNSICKQLVS